MENVRVTPGARQKYVLVRTLHAGSEELLLWGDPTLQWHKEIVDKMPSAGYEVVEVLGGGWLLPKPEEGTIYVWGKSDRYGLAPMNIVRQLLGGSIIEQEPE